MQQKGAQPPDDELLDDVLPGEPPPEELLLEVLSLFDRQPPGLTPVEELPQMLPPQRDSAHSSQSTPSSQPVE